MGNVCYFNVNYECNNACRFCFSHNVGIDKREMSISSFAKIIDKCNADDLIIINGGEPTLHSQFCEMVDIVVNKSLLCNIYSNGRILSEIAPKVELSNMVKFIIPIHGNRKIHDYLTRVTGSYDDAVHSLNKINGKIRYDLKFILNQEMMDDDFSIYSFIKDNDLLPENVVLARMNQTRKSKGNNYHIPAKIEEISYLKKCIEQLHYSYNLTLLDFPLCYFESSLKEYVEIKKMSHGSKFYYSDDQVLFQKRKYLKKRLKHLECKECEHDKLCDYISESYDVLKYEKDKDYLLLDLE